MAALAGLDLEVGIGQDLIQLAFVAGDAVRHGLRVGELHGVRHVYVVHDGGLVRVQLLLLFRKQLLGFFFGGFEEFHSQLRIVNQELPLEVAALAVVQVAGLAGPEVGLGIAVDGAVDVAVLQVGISVALHAAGDIGRGGVVHALARRQDRGEGILGLRNARAGDGALGLVAAVDHEQAVGLADVGVVNEGFVILRQLDQLAGRQAIGIRGDFALQRQAAILQLELAVGVGDPVDAEVVCLGGIERLAVQGHVEGDGGGVRIRRERVLDVCDLQATILIQFVVVGLVRRAIALMAERTSLDSGRFVGGCRGRGLSDRRGGGDAGREGKQQHGCQRDPQDTIVDLHWSVLLTWILRTVCLG